MYINLTVIKFVNKSDLFFWHLICARLLYLCACVLSHQMADKSSRQIKFTVQQLDLCLLIQNRKKNIGDIPFSPIDSQQLHFPIYTLLFESYT